MFSPFYSYYWGRGIQMPNSDAESAKQEAMGAVAKVRELEARLEQALLACETMWTFLRDKVGVSEEEFIEKMTEIDLQDGKLDGKLKRKPLECKKCQRVVSPRYVKCPYCGEAVERAPFA